MDPPILPVEYLTVSPENAYQSVHHWHSGGAGFVQSPPEKGPPFGRASFDQQDRNHRSAGAYHGEPMDARPLFNQRVPPPWSTAAIPPWSTQSRPLSDIRELTEPSLAEITNRLNLDLNRRPSARSSHSRRASLSRRDSQRSKGSGRQELPLGLEPIPTLLPNSSTEHRVRPENIPPRTSSQPGRDRRPLHPAPLPPAPPRALGFTIPNHGRSQSPVKDTAARLDPIFSNGLRRVPSRTFVRPHGPNCDVFDFPTHRHPRVAIELHVGAPIFVGGGSVEGHVRILVEDTDRIRHKRPLALSRISVDLLGVEEVSGPRRHIFLSLATELIDADNPPPHNMVESLKQISPLDPFWTLAPSVSNLPFMLSLPLDVGPPPFHSKHARIRYVLCVTLLIREQGRQFLVRSSSEVTLLPVYDPEKALMSLPSPLTASDEYVRHRDHGPETIKVTAGLHRQVWVSGTSIFVDVHVANGSKKTIKRLDLQLERDILCYKHAAAWTLEKDASQARIFDNNERTILCKAALKHGHAGWTGVSANSTDLRTCDLDLPRGLATVKCGKFFEVRYFLNVVVYISHSRTVTVQLPIVLIHMNSLDVVPNSVAQVAAAIEEKRARGTSHRRAQSSVAQLPPAPFASSASAIPLNSQNMVRRPSTASVQGRAFAAPRNQSLERMRAEQEELQALGQKLEHSPRKYSPRRRVGHNFHSPSQYGSQSQPPPSPGQAQQGQHMQYGEDQASNYVYQTPPSNRKARILSDEVGDEVAEIRERLRRMRSNETNRSAAMSGTGCRRQRSVGSSRSRCGSFRELERPEGLRGMIGKAGRCGGSATSQFIRRMRSGERWRAGAGAFFAERNRERTSNERDREREHEREVKQRVLANWI
ncbi:hypothetical protein EJ06DRAFT_553869 [Trichodelitschia bisporula]|uniref:Arrestin C-terminal-like domain-containing protein n=1 Tax=Trichodelitschia bisporula TaxID=703511 RepID=A0A6G1I647_9PEZI|nr:hypothetical protein EJ06DRAFT_553869 [Trichodelitschia bisporula]